MGIFGGSNYDYYNFDGYRLVPEASPAGPKPGHRLLSLGMPESHPQAFAQLARDALATLAEVRQGHATQRERGDGWCLVARPARPDWPIDLEQAARSAAEAPVDLQAICRQRLRNWWACARKRPRRAIRERLEKP
ncbi:hypothetical protein ACWDTT_13595 [Streptosporangium sandarakinum]